MIERLNNGLLRAFVFLALTLVALLMFDMSIPRDVRYVVGTVAMFDTTANESSVWYGMTVGLDGGGVVHAKNPMKATTAVGSRVELSSHWIAEGNPTISAPADSPRTWMKMTGTR